jgi:hypothetical protein
MGFFSIMNPIANTPVFVSLTASDSPVIRRRVAVKALLTTPAIIVIFCLCGALILISGRVAVAAEGASSNYFPGSYGTVAVAIPPTEGWTYLNYNLFYAAEAEQAVLQGRLNVDLDTSAYFNMSSGIYVFEEPVLGGRFAMGATLPIGYAALDSQSVGPTGTMAVDDSETGLGDMLLLPASLFWNDGNWNFNLYELIVAPTGKYDVNDNVNIGRNYWSFDTVFAVTNLDMTTGRDFSLVAGYMINTENDATDYKTGHELHVDAMFNQFVSEAFALGLHGYFYQQVTGDSGSGAILGDFKGQSYGIGPSFLWIPKSGGGNFSVTGTWLHDLHATDRMEGDYAVVTLTWQFGESGSGNK